MSQIYKASTGGGNIPIPVPVVDGGTGNTGHGELTINPTQSVFSTVDGTVTGITNIFTFPSRFLVTEVILQPVSITGIPDMGTFSASIGTNNPTYDNFDSGIPAPGVNLYDMTFEPDIDPNGNIDPGASFKINITGPVTVATVYLFRVYIQGFYF